MATALGSKLKFMNDVRGYKVAVQSLALAQYKRARTHTHTHTHTHTDTHASIAASNS